MPLVTKCTHCNKPSQIPENYAGKQVRCPTCKQIFVAQTAPPAPPKPVAAMANRETAQVAQQQRPTTEKTTPPVPPLQGGEGAPLQRGGEAGTARAPTTQPMPAVAPLGKSRPPAPPAAPSTVSRPAAGHGEHLRRRPLSRVQGPAKPRRDTLSRLRLGAARHYHHRFRRATGPLHESRLRRREPADRALLPRCNTMLPTAAGTMLQGRYQVEKLLAIGGFGAVYLAKDVKANRQMAIKDMICADPQEFSIRLNFFRREAEILRSLESLAVVPKVYDFIHQGQQPTS